MEKKLARKSYSELFTEVYGLIKIHYKELFIFVGALECVIYLLSMYSAHHTSMALVQSGETISISELFSIMGVGSNLLKAVLGVFMTATVLQYLSQISTKKKVSIWSCTKTFKENGLLLILAGIIVYTFISVGVLLFIFPGLILLVFLWMVIPAIVLDDESLADAFAKSFHYISRQFWHTAGLIAAFGLASFLLIIPIGWVVALLPDLGKTIVSAVYMIALMTLVSSAGLCLMYIYYYELKRLHPKALK